MAVLSLGEFLWTVLAIFFMTIYLMMIFQIIIDVFRREDASGGKKALWLLFLLVAPFLGPVVYLLTNSHGMTERAMQYRAGMSGAAPAGGGGTAAEIERAKSLLDSGAITDAEYQQIKARVLAAT